VWFGRVGIRVDASLRIFCVRCNSVEAPLSVPFTSAQERTTTPLTFVVGAHVEAQGGVRLLGQLVETHLAGEGGGLAQGDVLVLVGGGGLDARGVVRGHDVHARLAVGQRRRQRDLVRAVVHALGRQRAVAADLVGHGVLAHQEARRARVDGHGGEAALPGLRQAAAGVAGAHAVGVLIGQGAVAVAPGARGDVEGGALGEVVGDGDLQHAVAARVEHVVLRLVAAVPRARERTVAVAVAAGVGRSRVKVEVTAAALSGGTCGGAMAVQQEEERRESAAACRLQQRRACSTKG